MSISGHINEFFGGRPERKSVELRFTCDGDACTEADVLNHEIFRIHAYVKGVKEPVGNALVGVNTRGPKPEFYLRDLKIVSSSHRGASISSQILDKLEEIIRSTKGICRLKDGIPDDSKASGMYEKRGWRKEGEHLVFP